jgi:tetratricopeptide repeat protein
MIQQRIIVRAISLAGVAIALVSGCAVGGGGKGDRGGTGQGGTATIIVGGRVVTSDPNAAAAQLQTQAQAYLNQGKWSDAERDFRAALALKQDAASYRGLGIALHRLNRFAGARDAYRKCSLLQTNEWRCAYDEAMTFIDEARVQNAPDLRKQTVAMLEPLHERYPDAYIISAGLGLTHLLMNRPSEAKQILGTIKDVDHLDRPLNVYVPYNLALADIWVARNSRDAGEKKMLLEEAATLVGEAARRATRDGGDARETFAQLLRDLTIEDRRDLQTTPAWKQTRTDLVSKYGFVPPELERDQDKVVPLASAMTLSVPDTFTYSKTVYVGSGERVLVGYQGRWTCVKGRGSAWVVQSSNFDETKRGKPAYPCFDSERKYDQWVFLRVPGEPIRCLRWRTPIVLTGPAEIAAFLTTSTPENVADTSQLAFYVEAVSKSLDKHLLEMNNAMLEKCPHK